MRAIGSDLRMDYTAVGQTTHLAARMEQLAAPGTIVVTPATLALVEGLVAVTSLGPVPVKGLAEPLEVFEVTGVGAARTRLHAAARRGLTRFVGRDRELEQLWRAQELAGKGRGQVAAVVGEAGVGKSRLVYEFTHSHRLQGWLVLEAASVSYGKATSYLPVIALLKGYFKIQDRDDQREMREKVTGKLLALDRALEPSLPALLSLLDVPVDDPAWQTMAPPQRRRQTLDGVKRLLLREAREQPLAGDLRGPPLDRRRDPGPAGRVGREPRLGRGCSCSSTTVPSTSTPGRARPTTASSGWTRCRRRAPPTCWMRSSATTPASARSSSCSSSVATRSSSRRPSVPWWRRRRWPASAGRYRLAQPIGAIQIPATVQAMLAARIDRLPPEAKRLLQVASVVGKDVPFILLREIAEEPEESAPLTAVAAADGGVPARDRAVSRPRVLVQARADPGGHLR